MYSYIIERLHKNPEDFAVTNKDLTDFMEKIFITNIKQVDRLSSEDISRMLIISQVFNNTDAANVRCQEIIKTIKKIPQSFNGVEFV